MSLSKREKVLLYILALVLVLVGGWVGVVLPLQRQARDAQNRLRDAQARQQEIEMMTAALTGVEDRLAQEEKRLRSENYFYHDIQDVFVDRTVVRVAQEQGAALLEVEIEDPVNALLEPFEAYSHSMEPLDEAVEAASGAGAEEAQGPAAPLFSCTLTLAGSKESCMGMAAGLNTLGNSVYVSDFTLQRDEDDPESLLYEAEITVLFYYLEDPE